MYTLGFITIAIPLFFSHFFARFGEAFVIMNGIGYFESVKVSLFLGLLCIASVEFLWGREKHRWIQFIYLLVGGASFTGLGYYLYDPISFSHLIFGVGEKQHGIVFYLGILWYTLLIFSLKTSEKKYLIHISIATGIILAVIGIIEVVLRYNIFLGGPYETIGSWGSIRSTSTLGNPNYVAGYLLILFPLIFQLKKSIKYGCGILLFLGILVTQSVIALSLLFLFWIYYLFLREYSRRLLILCILGISLIGIILFSITSENDKWLSLFSRFILMKEVLFSVMSDIKIFFIGGGPESVITIFRESNSATLREYFSESMVIDSSHNIFLDLFAKFGIFSLFGIVLLLKYQMPKIKKEALYAVVLGILFYSLNVVTIAPILLFVLILSLKEKD